MPAPRSTTVLALLALAAGAVGLVAFLAVRGAGERDRAAGARSSGGSAASAGPGAGANEVEAEAAARRRASMAALHPAREGTASSEVTPSSTATADAGAAGATGSQGAGVPPRGDASAGAAGAGAGGGAAVGSASGSAAVRPRGGGVMGTTGIVAGRELMPSKKRAGWGAAIGRVVRAEGDEEGVPGARVACVQGQKASYTTETDESGGFRLELPPGVRALVFTAARRGATVRRVDVTAGQDASVGDVVLEAFGRIEGIIRRPDASPWAAVEVEANIGEGERRVATSGPDGRFAFEHVPADTYFLRVKSEPSENVAAVVRPGETARVFLGGVPQIVGVLKGPLGRPPRDRSVVVVSASIGAGGPEAGADVLRAFAEAQGRDIRIDDRGSFEIGGLAAGRYIVGRSTCYEEADVPVTPSSVPPGETIFVPAEIELQPGVIEARLLPAPGEPEIDGQATIHAVREEMLERGLGGDGRALLLSTLSEPAQDLAPSGGAACLVPQAGRYLLLARGGVVAGEAVHVDIARAGRAQVMLPVRRAGGALVLTGCPVGEIALAAVREAGTRRVIAVETFSIQTRIALPTGRYILDLVYPYVGKGSEEFEIPASSEAVTTIDCRRIFER